MGQRGFWFDGKVALERPVTVGTSPRHLLVTDDNGDTHEVATADLVRLGSDEGQVRLGHRAIDGWRLVLTAPFDAAVVDRLPARRGWPVSPGRRATMASLIGLCAAATAAVGLVVFAPAAVARHMPMAWERKLGAAFDLPIDAARCDDPRAEAALWAIVGRLDPDARRDGFSIDLLDLGEANAAALPGGRMIVFNGLFEEVGDADAIAGIVAHEIAHVRRRHVAAGMVRQLGLGTVVTLLGGGAIAGNANQLASLHFTRDAEAEADADAIAMLARAGISPRPTARAFAHFAAGQGDWPEWLDSHPASRSRAARFAASARAGARYRPALDPIQAAALRNACRD